jgi:hypothetical protein
MPCRREGWRLALQHRAGLAAVGGAVEIEDELTWLRHRVVRLRAVLRFVQDPQAEVMLRELIADAEDRLLALERDNVTAIRRG